MRILSDSELNFVAGGYVDNGEWPDQRTQEFYTSIADSCFDSYIYNSKEGVIYGRVTVQSAASVAEVLKSISDAFPKGEAECKVKVTGGTEKPMEWEIDCKAKIVRK
ncbi:hypothetical protein [Pseudoduganella violacea]|uniref:Uncharacterized protein n=1 Tax=Pseudoduganella violacea TaxID=1715466 RepID=A0A7W5FWA8_9BURK|nr:hypothetical protein [Pseudoduganella violacea]MBB3121073.1 hypothetical protein [Pseudoduganella violacea]